MAKSVVDVLQEAKSVLMEHGVAREHFYDPTTNSYCSLGAVEVAAGIRNQGEVKFGRIDEQWRLRDKAADFLYLVMESVPHFNDTHPPGEVLARFDDAILKAKQWEVENA
jgi:hypothetical protein